MNMSKIKPLPILLHLLLLCSACQDRTTRYRTQIVGEWQPADTQNMVAYCFEADETCRKYAGFFEYTDSMQPTVENPFSTTNSKEPDIPAAINNIIRYYRSHSCYKIEDNCLKIFDPALKAWDIYHISFKTANALVLSGKDNGVPQRYIRKQPVAETDEPLFEQILIYHPPTDFTCGKFYSFDLEGRFLSCEIPGTDDSGKNSINNIRATIDINDYLKLDGLFKHANIETYLHVLTRNEVNNLFSSDKPAFMFIKGGKMYTFNSDFERIPPEDFKVFYQACFSALFYSENLSFKPQVEIEITEFLYDFHSFRLRRLYAGDREIRLSGLEYFYLMSLIRRAPETTEAFQPVYTFKGGKKSDTVLTDGRCFTYWAPVGKRTVDIGFNFIEKNGVDTNFEAYD